MKRSLHSAMACLPVANVVTGRLCTSGNSCRRDQPEFFVVKRRRRNNNRCNSGNSSRGSRSNNHSNKSQNDQVAPNQQNATRTAAEERQRNNPCSNVWPAWHLRRNRIGRAQTLRRHKHRSSPGSARARAPFPRPSPPQPSKLLSPSTFTSGCSQVGAICSPDHCASDALQGRCRRRSEGTAGRGGA